MTDIVMKPIGLVHSTRAEPIDDHWLEERAHIELDATCFTKDALAGLIGFSHVIVVYVMHAVDPAQVELVARNPRNRVDWPKVGIFAQRAKRRPNRIGVSCCRLLAVDGLRVHVEALTPSMARRCSISSRGSPSSARAASFASPRG